MRIYVSGIGGVAMGPLAMIARDMGYDVLGSDAVRSELTDQMQNDGFSAHIPQNDGHIKRVHAQEPIDWFVHTAALTEDHP